MNNETINDIEVLKGHNQVEFTGFLYEYLYKIAQIKYLDHCKENSDLISTKPISNIYNKDIIKKLYDARSAGSDDELKNLINKLYLHMSHSVNGEAETLMSHIEKQLSLALTGKDTYKLQIEKLHAPIDLKDFSKIHGQGQDIEERYLQAEEFKENFNWSLDGLESVGKGMAGHADYLSLYRLRTKKRPLKKYLILHACEYSYNTSEVTKEGMIKDMSVETNQSSAIRSKTTNNNRLRLTSMTNTTTKQFSLPIDDRAYETIIYEITTNKELYKLCQVSSYLIDSIARLVKYGNLKKLIEDGLETVYVLGNAITNYGIQSIGIPLDANLILKNKDLLQDFSAGEDNAKRLYEEYYRESDKSDGKLHLLYILGSVYRHSKPNIDASTNEGFNKLKKRIGKFSKKILSQMSDSQISREITDHRHGIFSGLDLIHGGCSPSMTRTLAVSDQTKNNSSKEINASKLLELETQVTDFFNTSQEISPSDFERLLPKNKHINWGDDVINIEDLLHRDYKEGFTFRDAHACFVRHALETAVKGHVNKLFLTGNPGIGKTTTLKNTVIESEIFSTQGAFLNYLSPRIVINDDTSKSFAYDNSGEIRNICTITTDSKAIKSYKDTLKFCYETTKDLSDSTLFEETEIEVGELRKAYHLSLNTESVVCVSGVDLRIDDTGNFKHGLYSNNQRILVLNEKIYSLIKEDLESPDWRSSRVDQHSVVIERDGSEQKMGVFKTIYKAFKFLSSQNTHIKRFVVISSSQAYKITNNGNSSTINGLNNCFKHPVKGDRIKDYSELEADEKELSKVIAERKEFLKLFPNYIVMIDELTGDEAGAYLYKELYIWIYNNLILPMKMEEDQFKVILIGADASLTNEQSVNNYFDPIFIGNKSNSSQVIINDSEDESPLSMVYSDVFICNKNIEKLSKTVHVKANSFPANNLGIRHSIIDTFCFIDSENSEENKRILKYKHEEINNERAATLIALKTLDFDFKNELNPGENDQTLVFYQNKLQLEEIENLLKNPDKLLEMAKKFGYVEKFKEILNTKHYFEPKEIMTINSDQMNDPKERKRIGNNKVRMKVKAFLVTSSAARGISLPFVTNIIAHVQGFAIESGIAEICQVIYRGRGGFVDKNGRFVSGDKLNRIIDIVTEKSSTLNYSSNYEKQEELLIKKGLLTDTLSLSSHVGMIEAAIRTRITGSCTFKKGEKVRRLSVIPVGGVGVSTIVGSFCQNISSMLKDLSVLQRNEAIIQSKDMMHNKITSASEEIINLFSNQEVLIQTEYNDFENLMFDDFDKNINLTNSNDLPLVKKRDVELSYNTKFQSKGGLVIIPLTGESVNSWALSASQTKDLKIILSKLYDISIFIENNEVLKNKFKSLRSRISEFYDVFKKFNNHMLKSQNLINSTEMNSAYLVIPSSYPLMTNEQHEKYTEEWKELLYYQLRSLSFGSVDVSLISPFSNDYIRYQNESNNVSKYPFIVVMAGSDPVNFEGVIGNKGIMTTKEINTLMMLL